MTSDVKGIVTVAAVATEAAVASQTDAPSTVVARQWVEAFERHRQAAAGGCATAMVGCAYFYLYGMGATRIQRSTAIAWLDKALATGHREAAWLRVFDLTFGAGTNDKDDAHAMDVLESRRWQFPLSPTPTTVVATLGDLLAAAAMCFLTCDDKKQVEWSPLVLGELRSLADAGDPFAAWAASLLASEGHSTVRNEAVARRYCEAAARQGHAAAQRRWAAWLPNDEEGRIEWYTRAAEQGDPIANLRLASVDANVPCRVKRTEFLLKAAVEGDLAAAQYELGDAYNRGWGVPRDPKRALDMYRRASAHGHTIGHLRLARMHQRGEGGATKDMRIAIQLLRKAHERGNEDARHKLKRLGAC